MVKSRGLLVTLCLLLSPAFIYVQDTSGAQLKQPLVSVVKIWDRAPHNAFTDLIRFQGRWFCTFREGKDHVSSDGALRVITSTDGMQWESAALITSKN
ncbi:MAG: hypothetical protein RMJ82_08570, partial [Gemmatales bacterium]|nr:hypothetical protein [Gemmatales bacterium]